MWEDTSHPAAEWVRKCLWCSECGGLVVDLNDTVDLWNPHFLDEATEVQRTKVRCSRSLHKGKESGFGHSCSQFHSPCSLHCVLPGCCLACGPGPKGANGSWFWCSAALNDMQDQVLKEFSFWNSNASIYWVHAEWRLAHAENWSLPHNGFLRRAAGLSSPSVTGNCRVVFWVPGTCF